MLIKGIDPSKADKIKNIIFDWGGVIINIDYNKTAEAFNKLGIKDFDQAYSQSKQSTLFDDFEIGTISPEQFRKGIHSMLPLQVSDSEIDTAWTAMLLDLPKERLEILEKVKKHYNTFLLSNTNKIHVDFYLSHLDKIYGFEKFKSLFRKIYFSHEIGLKKPDVEIFKYVINENNLIPEETLFIDDSPQHVVGATRAGLIAYHLKQPQTIIDLFLDRDN